MVQDQSPGATGPEDEGKDPLDAGLRAAYGSGRHPHSTQPIIESLGVGDSRIMLRDPPGEHTPVVNPRSAELEPGEYSTGRYRVLGEIGQGGVGVILKARDVDLGRDVALKLLRRELAENPLIVERFVEEAQVGAQLQHPGVVPVYELGLMADKRPYFTMQLVKGETLAALLADRESPQHGLRRMLGIFEQVCQAVAFAHARDVVHRDLKPSNVMLGAFGEIQVVDWGFAKVGSAGEADRMLDRGFSRSQISIIETVRSVTPASESMVGSVLGTPAYMPPEQARGDIEKLDARSDVFALGAILCEILTGLPPYTGETNQAVLFMAARARLEEAQERLAACNADSGLVRLAGECLSPARAARPPDAGAIAVEIGAYLASVEKKARDALVAAEAEKVRARQERRARRLTLAVAAGILLAALAGGGIFIWMTGQSRKQSGEAVLAVNAALDEADVHRRQADAGGSADLGLLERAREAGLRALALAREEDAGPALLKRSESLVTELEARISHVRSADEIKTRNRVMLARTSELRTCRCPQRDPRRIGQAYADAFREYGIDFESVGPEDAAGLVRESAIRDDLCDALAAWVVVRREHTEDGELTGAILAALQLADPDPVRVEIRSAAALPEPGQRLERLRRVEKSARASSLPARTAALLGGGLASAGAVGEAAAVLTDAALAHPRDFWIHYQLAFCATQLDAAARESAMRHYAAARSLKPDSAELADSVGTVILEHGGPSWAVTMWRRGAAASEDPSRKAHLLTHVADALVSADRLEEAAAALREAEETGEADASFFRTKGRLLLAQGSSVDAMKALDRAVSVWPGFEVAHRDRIRAYHAAGRVSSIVRECQEAIDEDPQRPRVWMRLGLCRSLEGDLEGAVSAYEKACTHSHGDVDCRVALGWAQLEAGETEAAADAFRRATEAAPGRDDARHGLGVSLIASGELETAVQELVRALEGGRNAGAILVDLGFALRRKGDFHGAIGRFQHALHLDATSTAAHLGLGEILLLHGELPPAIQELRRAVDSDPDCLTAVRLLMRALGRSGALDGEIASLRREAERGPQKPLPRMLLGAALEEAGRTKEASAAYQDAVIQPSASAGAFVLGGLAWEREGKPESAFKSYKEAVRLSPRFPEARCRLGLAGLEAGKFEMALRQLRRGHGAKICSPGPHLPSGRWLLEAERMVELEKLVPALLAGRHELASATEKVEAARMLARTGHLGETASVFRDALDTNPSLIWDPVWDNALWAATAALSRAGGSDPESRAKWRERAVRWLEDSLAFMPARLARGEGRQVRNTLYRWTKDEGLREIREGDRIAALPDEEKTACRALWQEVDRLMKDAARR